MQGAQPTIQVAADAAALSEMAAHEFVCQAQAAVQARGVFTVALAGGSTPKSLYARLASTTSLSLEQSPGSADRGLCVPWDKVHVFWGDERHVPPDHTDSNYRMAYEAMLSKVPVPPANVHRIKTETPDAHTAAAEYEQELQSFFRLAPGQLPRFDLVLLGMGPDGHTASLFPGTDALHEPTRLVVAPWVEKFHTYRVTLTLPVLNNAAKGIFLVSGEDKAETLRAVLQGDHQPDSLPAQGVHPTQGTLLWLVDRAAARFLRLLK